MQGRDRFAVCKAVRDLADLMLAHAEHEKIGIGIKEHRGANGIVPVIIVRETAQGCFQSSDAKRNVAPDPADRFAVDVYRAVGAFARLAARRVVVVMTLSFGGGVMRHHRVDVAAVGKEGKAWSAESLIVRIVLRLRQDADAEALRFQHARNDCRAEARMVDVGVARDNDDVRRVPAARLHFFSCDR